MRRTLCALLITATTVTTTWSTDNSHLQFGTWGFDLAGSDFSLAPGDDFFRFVNGGWIERTEIPADKPAYSLRLVMSDAIEQRLHELFEQAVTNSNSSELLGKVRAFYKSFMDEKQVERLGASPIAVELNAVREAQSRSALAGLMGRNGLDFEPAIFEISVDPDLQDPKRYAVYLNQSGLGLPDRDYYLNKTFAKTKETYRAYIAKVLHLIGWPDSDQRASGILDFETKIAQVSWNRAQARDVVATYNPMTIAELQALTPGFDWQPYLAASNLAKIDRVVVGEITAFPKIADIFANTSEETLRAWLAFRIADKASPYLSNDFSNSYFEFHQRTIIGQQQQQPRWKRAVYAVGGGDCLLPGECFGTLKWAVGKLYAERYFPPDAKAKIEDLVWHLKTGFQARLEKLDWMSAATKIEAIKKLGRYNVKVGYPISNRDYSSVQIRDDDLLGNVRRAAPGVRSHSADQLCARWQ
jgi:putative endopeptidase